MADILAPAEQLSIIPKREPGKIIESALSHDPVGAYVMFSGGKDSSVLLDYMIRNHRAAFQGVVHINTGIGIPSTNEFVRKFCREQHLELFEIRSPRGNDYERIVTEHGFPGPAQHAIMYRRLKERALRVFIRERKRHRMDKVVLYAGARLEESKRRMGTSEEITKVGAQLWVNPIIDFTNRDMWEHRERYSVEMSEAARLIHMSGECLCGSMASPHEAEELNLIRMFFPDTYQRIYAIGLDLKQRGNPRCIWGKKLDCDLVPTMAPGPMCVGCGLGLFDQDQEAA